MKNLTTCIFLLLMVFIILNACKKDKMDKNSDVQLYTEITQSGFTYFQNGNLLNGVSPSPHGAFKLRFNSIAFAALDSAGKLPVGSMFPAGSILVKEVYTGNTLSLYVVMKKDPSNENAGNDWVWAEFNTDGSVDFSVTKKGDACIGCHSGSPNRDLTRTFDLH
ncbi:MAG TPA: cytochrome P460 family protein [Bacteroidia bacterium]|nr:cytochrome P460 family protein [Bacteroidia bacterium]